MLEIHKMTVIQVKDFLSSQEELTPELEETLLSDGRTGVMNAYESFKRKREKALLLKMKWDEMCFHEKELWANGYHWIAGVDEVGRGPLAGPVVAAAVILPRDVFIPGLNDSKKCSPSLREELFDRIMEDAVAVSIGMADSLVIDEINIYQGTLRAMSEALQGLSMAPHITLNDAVTIPGVPFPQRPIIGGDGKSISIAAASIVAKVTRDRMMKEYDLQYPGYGFSSNMGYGTEEHLLQLRKLGPCPIHRRSFAGVIIE